MTARKVGGLRFRFFLAFTLILGGGAASTEAQSDPAQPLTPVSAKPESIPFPIQHKGRTPNNWWSITEGPSVRILHNQHQKLAEDAARITETTRAEIIRIWFSDDPEAPAHRCEVFLYASADEYRRFTGVGNGSPGHSTIKLDGGRPVTLRMDLHCEDPQMMLKRVLPHETVHIAIAGRFRGAHPPRWFDEGMGILAEEKTSIERHRTRLQTLRTEQGLFTLKDLMEMADYPERKYVDLFYAQSVSAAAFLRDQKDPQTVTAFIRTALKEGYPASLEKHYKMTFEELDKEWRLSLERDPAPAKAK